MAVTGPREHEVIVGQSCYFINPSTNLAETAFLIDPAWQGSGLGSAMQSRMKEDAMARSLRGFSPRCSEPPIRELSQNLYLAVPGRRSL